MSSKPKGTYDVLPGESERWINLEGAIRKVCRLYNFKEIRTPIFESYDVFHRNQDDSSDMVNKETYDFTDRSDRKMTLRPEGTAGVIRAYVENKIYANEPLSKLYYVGPMFRYERPQKGRNRQFSQFGVELLGSDSPLVDVEVISLGVTLIKAIGLKNVKVKINSLGDSISRVNYKNVLVKHFSSYKDELCEDCKERLVKNPLRLLDCKVCRDKEFFINSPKINDYLNLESKKRFETVLEALNSLGIEYEVSPNLVRGLDYYSHTVFELEVDIPEFGAQNVIGAGGRYDNLVKELGGPDITGVGMAFGLERLLMAAEFGGKTLKSKDFVHVYFISLGEKAKAEALKQISLLRNLGLVCDMDYVASGLKAQFKHADNANAMFTCILGDNELEKSEVNIKDNLTDEQETIKLNEIFEYVMNKIKPENPCAGCVSGRK